ncbi:hypothetical protein BKA93DRAFT_736801 [Sparassis latifolia]
MNSLWNFLDWFLPSVRLSDDLEDPYALSDDGYSVLHLSSPASSPPRTRSQRRDWTQEHDREYERDRERERDKDPQRIQTLERDNAALHQRISSLEHDLQSARQSLATVSLLSSSIPPSPEKLIQQQVHHPQNPDLVSLRTSYDSLMSSYSVMHRTLQERNEEVASMKSFLSKTDEWSGAQLLQALHDLNAEIVQLAASVAEEFAPSLDRHVNLSRLSDHELVTKSLGPIMTNLLETRDHAGDPTLVQFAIQAWEVCCVGRVLDAFCFGLPEEVDRFLAGVFSRMHRAEPQPTTSRWRALTYMHARASLPPSADSSSSFHSLNETNLRGLLAILAISGCTDSRGVHRDPLRTRFGGALARIGERAERIAGAVKEGVMSGVFEVTWVTGKGVSNGLGKEGEWWFDRATMDNVYAGHGSERCKVLCTVEFGLLCVQRVGWASANVNGNEVDSHVINLLLKPKVLLESVSEIL